MTEFQLVDVWPSSSQGDCIVLHTLVVPAAAKLNILFTVAEARWKLKACATTQGMLHLAHLAWENMTTNVTYGGRVCSYWPRPPTSYTVQQSREV